MDKDDSFNPIVFEKKLMGLKDTQDSIQSMSSWCLKQRTHHKKIVSSWLNVLKRAKLEQRLVLFYLANDVIQYSKRKNYEFVESWGLNLQKATPLVRDEKVRHKILRIFKIWEQRSVYDEEFLSDLTGLLSAGAVKKASDDDAIDFQPQQLVNKIKQCSVLESDTDARLKSIHDSKLQLADPDLTCARLKELGNLSDVESVEKELTDGIERVERYTAALQREIVAREALLALLACAHQYYNQQRGEVKVVAYAYKNFGARVRCQKRKLDEKLSTLPPRRDPTPSPPRPGEHVPSPGPDEDLPLPNTDDETSYNIDKTFSTSISVESSMYNPGFSSFLGSDNMFSFFQDGANDTTASKIEVINNAVPASSEKSEFNINDFLKNLTTEQPVTTNNVLKTSMTEPLPGLSLLTEHAALAPPQLSFYGSLDGTQDEPESYEEDPQWSNTPASWGAVNQSAPRLSPAPLSYSEAPASPPAAPALAPAPLVVPEARHYVQDMPLRDVDHRGMLPPPPPPPALLPALAMVELEDVDHRQMPVLPPPAAVPPPPVRPHKDVDHRNLISLTSHPPANARIPPGSTDQDYRVPAPVPPPSDIVESVDMDLSDDDLAATDGYVNDRGYSQPIMQFDDQRRHKNNKVLVGGDNGVHPVHVTRSPPKERQNLIRINSLPSDTSDPEYKMAEPHSAPIKPMVNPFDTPSYGFQDFERKDVNFDNIEEAMKLMDSTEKEEDPFVEDLLDRFPEQRNPSPPREYQENNWGRGEPRFPMNPRFQRNWGQPRPFFRQPYGQRPFTPRHMGRPPWNVRPRGGYW